MSEDNKAAQDGVVMFFGNIPWSSTADDVVTAIKNASGINVDARLSARKDGRSRGYATARVSEEESEKLTDLGVTIELEGREMRVERRKRRSRKDRKDRKRQAGDDDEVEDNKQDESEAKKGAGRRRNRRRNRRKTNDGGGGGDTKAGNEQKDEQKKDGILLFFGNVPWDATAEDIHVAVENETGIKIDVRVSARKDGRSRGYATARCNESDANDLMAKTGEIMVGDRNIRIEQKKRRPRRMRRNRKEEGAEKSGEEGSVDE